MGRSSADFEGAAVASVEHVAARLPWLDRVEARVRDDSFGEPAIELRLVVRSGITDLFEDGARLADARRTVRAALDAAGIDLWAFIRFISADEIAAA